MLNRFNLRMDEEKHVRLLILDFWTELQKNKNRETKGDAWLAELFPLASWVHCLFAINV